MAILVDENTKGICQGFTGSQILVYRGETKSTAGIARLAGNGVIDAQYTTKRI